MCTHPCIQSCTLTIKKVPLAGVLPCGYRDDQPTAEDCSYRKGSQFPSSTLTELVGTHRHTVRLKIQITVRQQIIFLDFFER